MIFAFRNIESKSLDDLYFFDEKLSNILFLHDDFDDFYLLLKKELQIDFFLFDQDTFSYQEEIPCKIIQLSELKKTLLETIYSLESQLEKLNNITTANDRELTIIKNLRDQKIKQNMGSIINEIQRLENDNCVEIELFII